MNTEDLPDKPPEGGGPMTQAEIREAIHHYWVHYIGATQEEALERADRAFAHMLATGWLREWGFNPDGDVLYEPTTPQARQTIVYVIGKEKFL
jgi:hypothetical protein